MGLRSAGRPIALGPDEALGLQEGTDVWRDGVEPRWVRVPGPGEGGSRRFTWSSLSPPKACNLLASGVPTGKSEVGTIKSGTTDSTARVPKGSEHSSVDHPCQGSFQATFCHLFSGSWMDYFSTSMLWPSTLCSLPWQGFRTAAEAGAGGSKQARRAFGRTSWWGWG